MARPSATEPSSSSGSEPATTEISASRPPTTPIPNPVRSPERRPRRAMRYDRTDAAAAVLAIPIAFGSPEVARSPESCGAANAPAVKAPM